MSKGWKEVARLGGPGARYPQVLVDAHGWCLRLGRNRRQDEKYYSNLSSLLGGVIEHTARRRLTASSAALDLREFVTALQTSLEAARLLCRETLEKGGLEEHIRRLDARNAPGRPRESCLRLCEAPTGEGDLLPVRQANSAS